MNLRNARLRRPPEGIQTIYEEKKYEHTTLFIKAFVHKVIEVDGKKNIDRLPLFTA